MGLCPFHQEKTPSFTVHIARQFYKCFSCGAAGDVFKFVMEIEGLSFYEALKSLAERNGIPMPKRSQYADDDSRLRGRAACDARNRAGELPRQSERAGGRGGARVSGEARAGARRRSNSSGSGMRTVGARAAAAVRAAEFSAAQIEQSGLVGKREDGSIYDRFRNRLMFPIHDGIGQDHRVRRAGAGRGRQSEVLKFAGNADL